MKVQYHFTRLARLALTRAMSSGKYQQEKAPCWYRAIGPLRPSSASSRSKLLQSEVALLEGSVISECHAERVHTVATLDASCAADLPYPSRAEASEARGCRA